MIYVTRINGTPLVLNCDLIEQIEATPDTVITLTSGRNYMVLETPDELISRSVEYRRRILQPMNRQTTQNLSGSSLQCISGADHGC